VFGEGRLVPLDRNAKARIMVLARALMPHRAGRGLRRPQTATRAILQPYQLFPDCIIATLGRDFREGQGALHVVCFYTSWPDVVAAAPYCQTTLVIRMSTDSSPSALAPARGSRFVY
jgi:hypothetical protein